MGGRVARRNAPNDRATFPGILFCERRKHPRTSAHGKTGLAARVAHRQPICRFDQTIRSRQHSKRRARWRRGLRFAVAAWDHAKPNVDLALLGRARIRRRRALLDHALSGGGELLDRAGARPSLRLLQLPEHCPLSRRNLPADFSHDLWLDHSGGDYREYSRPPARQIAWTAGTTDAASCHCLEHYFLALPRLLEICFASLLERQFISSDGMAEKSTQFLGEISACAVDEMFLIKRPFLPTSHCKTPFTLWPNQSKRRG